MPSEIAVADAVEVLTARAREVRAVLGRWEQVTYGREWTASDLMDGFVVDVGDLTRLVMATTGRRVEPNATARLTHELADCLWSVLVLADVLDVELGDAFTTTMAELEATTSARLKP